MPSSTTEISVETFRPTKESRAAARLNEVSRVWSSAWVVRFWNARTQVAVLGGGSSRRVAAMRAAEAAVKEGWF